MTVAAIFSVLVLSQIVMLVIGHETGMTSRDRNPIAVTGPIGAAAVPYPIIRGKHLRVPGIGAGHRQPSSFWRVRRRAWVGRESHE